MPRLIYADEFRKRIDHYPPDIRDIAKKELRYTPTVDAVEVVRCRDCEWYKTHYSWDGKERKVCGIEPFEPIRQEEDYCSYGERKE